MTQMAREDCLKEIGENIRKRRETMRISQQELGLRLGTNANVIYRYETGQSKMSVSRLCQIASQLKTTPAQLCPHKDMDTNRKEAVPFDLCELMEGLSDEKKQVVWNTVTALVQNMKELQ